MGTDKRARQKANRVLKQEQMARQARTDQMKRTGLRVGIGVVAALAAVLGIAWAFGAFDSDDDSLTVDDPFATTATTAPGDTVDATATTVGSGDTTGDTVPTSDAATTDVATTAVPVEPTCPAEDGSSAPTRSFMEAPPMCIDETATYTALVTTNQGEFTIELDAARAPITVNNFVFLARYHYFDDTPCHRIIPGFVVQCGDPTGSGSGGPGYDFADELPEAGEYEVGSIAMANSGPDTNGSQFFVITGADGAALPPNYTLFGTVTDGLDDTVPALDALGNPDPSANGVPPLEPVTIESVTITES